MEPLLGDAREPTTILLCHPSGFDQTSTIRFELDAQSLLLGPFKCCVTAEMTIWAQLGDSEALAGLLVALTVGVADTGSV